MKRILSLFALATLITARPEPPIKTCNKDGQLEKEILKTNMDRPFMLSYDAIHEEVFFSFTNIEKNGTEVFEVGSISLKDNTYRTVDKVKNGFATAVTLHDGKSKIYIGAEKGIYTLNHTTYDAEFHGGESNIWYIFHHNDTLYFTTYPKRELKHLKDGKEYDVERFKNTEVILYIVDKHGDEFFTNKTALYRVVNDKFVPINTETDFRGVTRDKTGTAYFIGQDGVYTFDRAENKLEQFIDIPDLFGLTLDSESNFIYASSKSIIKFMRSNVKC